MLVTKSKVVINHQNHLPKGSRSLHSSVGTASTVTYLEGGKEGGKGGEKERDSKEEGKMYSLEQDHHYHA